MNNWLNKNIKPFQTDQTNSIQSRNVITRGGSSSRQDTSQKNGRYNIRDSKNSTQKERFYQTSFRDILPTLQTQYKITQKARSASPKPVSPEVKEQFNIFKPLTKVFAPEKDEDDDSLFVMKKILVPRGNRFQIGITDDQKRQFALYKDAKQSCQRDDLPLSTGKNFKIQKSLEEFSDNIHQINPRITLNGANKMKFKMVHTKNYQALIDQIDPETQVLDLSNVTITQEMIDKILNEILLKNIKVRRITAENSQLQNELSGYFVYQMKNFQSLRFLDLSMNRIGDKGAKLLAKFLKRMQLYELYLHWNLISNEGGFAILDEALECYQLKVLDLSCNQIGDKNSDRFIKRLNEFFLDNQSDGVVHIDISFNNFPNNQIVQICEDLKENHTVFGLHLAGGHDYFINSLGYLEKQDDYEENTFEAKILTRQMDKINSIKLNKSSRLYLKNDKDFIFNLKKKIDTCWICEGWQQIEFEIPSKMVGGSGRLYLHIDFLNFQPIQVEKDKYQNNYGVTVMCPPNVQMLFCFITQGNRVLLSPKYPVTTLKNQLFIKSCSQKQLEVFELNSISTNLPSEIITSDYNPKISVKPRIISTTNKQEETNYVEDWDPLASVFKDYILDYQGLLQKGFDHDQNKIRTTDRFSTEVSITLSGYYQSIYFSYCYIVAIGTQKNQIQMDNDILHNLLIQGKIIGENGLSLGAIQRIKKEASDRNPGNFHRYQYMFFLMKCAEEIYLRTRMVRTLEEAVQEAFLSGLLQSFRKIEYTKSFKEQVFWTEDFEKLYQAYENFIMNYVINLLRRNQRQFKKEGINFEEFLQMVKLIYDQVNSLTHWDPLDPQEIKFNFYSTIIDQVIKEREDQNGNKNMVQQPLNVDQVQLFEAFSRLVNQFKPDQEQFAQLKTNLKQKSQISSNSKIESLKNRFTKMLRSKSKDSQNMPVTTNNQNSNDNIRSRRRTTIMQQNNYDQSSQQIDIKSRLEMVIWIMYFKSEDLPQNLIFPNKFLFLSA